MLFMYWNNPEIEAPPAASAWKALYPNFKVFTDEDVFPLIPIGFEKFYRKIRLPSAKSDVARLLLLRRYGGLYIDAHVGPTSPECLLETIEKLSEYNLILFGKGWAMQKETDFDLMNGVIAARKGANELDAVIGLVIKNIRDQYEKEEKTADYVPYSVFGLTGTYTLIQAFFDQIPPRPSLKAPFKNTIQIHYMKDNNSSGFEIAAFYSYRKPGNHWSEREKNERFFIS
ncbi:MAG: hypothetical protein KGL20_02520 [Rhodospirillales bacterium]|nr:hypothetical protein [Rhodospirillales bacterium]